MCTNVKANVAVSKLRWAKERALGSHCSPGRRVWTALSSALLVQQVSPRAEHQSTLRDNIRDDVDIACPQPWEVIPRIRGGRAIRVVTRGRPGSLALGVRGFLLVGISITLSLRCPQDNVVAQDEQTGAYTVVTTTQIWSTPQVIGNAVSPHLVDLIVPLGHHEPVLHKI